MWTLVGAPKSDKGMADVDPAGVVSGPLSIANGATAESMDAFASSASVTIHERSDTLRLHHLGCSPLLAVIARSFRGVLHDFAVRAPLRRQTLIDFHDYTPLSQLPTKSSMGSTTVAA